jgi:3-oxoacyl-[acyl-carrier-protein] synthase II
MSVAITGLGIVCSLGDEPGTVFDAVCAGKSGAQRVERFASLGLEHVVAAPVERARVVARAGDASLPWPSAMAVVAARAALRDAGLAEEVGDAVLAAGCSMGWPGVVERYEGAWSKVDLGDPRCLADYSQGAVIAKAAAALGARGEVHCLTTTCAAGNYALGAGLDAIRSGAARALVGGVEELSTLPYVAFHQIRALGDVCRPFDASRAGLLFGEGAAFLVLEPTDSARARGARIYAELAGVGFSNDAFHLVAPDQEGAGAARAMGAALREAGVSSVDYVNAHGTGTPLNDGAESRAVVRVLGRATPLGSTKGATGHCLGAASAVEAVLTTLALERGVLPPTVGLERVGPDIEAAMLTGEARRAEVSVALSNGFGFGGNNATAVFTKPGRCGVTASRPVFLHAGAALWGSTLGVAGLGRPPSPRYDADLRDILGKKGLRHIDRGALLWAAAVEHDLPAWPDVPLERAGVAVGSAYPAYSGVVSLMREFQAGGAKNVNPALVPYATSNCAPSWYAIRKRVTGWSGNTGGGVGAGLDAVRLAAMQIERERIDVAVAGGVEAYTEELWRALADETLVEGACAVRLDARSGGARLLGSGAAFGPEAPVRASGAALRAARLERAEMAYLTSAAAVPAREVRVPAIGNGLAATGVALLLLALRESSGPTLVVASDPLGYATALLILR